MSQLALGLGRARTLRIAVLRLYADGVPRIPDEAAHELHEDFLAIRPRCAELHKEECLVETGGKRRARHGMAKVLRITVKGRDLLAELNRSAA